MANPEFLDLEGKKVSAGDVIICPVTGSLLVSPDKARDHPDLQKSTAVTKQVRDSFPAGQTYAVCIHSRSSTNLTL